MGNGKSFYKGVHNQNEARNHRLKTIDPGGNYKNRHPKLHTEEIDETHIPPKLRKSGEKMAGDP